MRIVSALACAWIAQAQAAPAKKAPQPQGVEASLRARVQESKPRLGALEEWQSVVFDEEVVPMYRRFIREFRQSGQQVTAEIDVPGIRKYLGFGARKGKGEGAIGLYVAADPGCPRCKEALPEVSKLARSRIERRGYKTVLIAANDLKSAAWGAEVNERVTELSREREMAGAMVIQVGLMSMESVDTAHADEVRYEARARIILHPREPAPEARSDGALEVAANDNLAQGVERILADLFTDAGGKLLAAAGAAETAVGDERMVMVRGVGGFEHYSKIKAQVLEALKDAGTVEERKSARGLAGFAVRTRKSGDELMGLLQGVGAEGRPVQVGVEE